MRKRSALTRTVLNYIRAILDVLMDFPEEEILRMYLENVIGVGLIVDDVKGRFERVMREKISDANIF